MFHVGDLIRVKSDSWFGTGVAQYRVGIIMKMSDVDVEIIWNDGSSSNPGLYFFEQHCEKVVSSPEET